MRKLKFTYKQKMETFGIVANAWQCMVYQSPK